MDNRISEIRRIIRALRLSMREAETIMQERIRRDEDCSFVAAEIMKMRVAMSGLAQERAVLGDTSHIIVSYFALPRRSSAERRTERTPRRKLGGRC